MKLKTIIDTLNKSKENSVDLYYGDLAIEEFDINETIFQNWDNPRITAHFFNSWLDTDTYVGGTILFFDNEPMAQGWRSGRKNGTEYYWFSIENYNKVRAFLESKIDREPPKIKLISLNDEYRK